MPHLEHRSLLRPLIAAAGIAALVCGSAAYGATPAPAAEQPDAGPPSGTPSCVTYFTQVIYRAYGYDHWVIIRNDCAAVAHCVVRTDVNPNPIETYVAPDSTKRVLTFRGSPSREFRASVSCELEKRGASR